MQAMRQIRFLNIQEFKYYVKSCPFLRLYNGNKEPQIMSKIGNLIHILKKTVVG